MAEPPAVTAMIAALRPHIFGASLCGAGGGGFLVGISREPGARATVEAALRADAAFGALAGGSGWEVFDCAVDTQGLVVAVEE
jgi:fucokinase